MVNQWCAIEEAADLPTLEFFFEYHLCDGNGGGGGGGGVGGGTLFCFPRNKIMCDKILLLQSI